MREKFDFLAQVILGLIFFVFGLNGFLGFIQLPPIPDPAKEFLGALIKSGYFFPVLKATEVICGFLLLARICSALALVILAPICLQILFFHTYLAPGGLPLAIVIVVLEAYLGFVVYRDSFKSVLAVRS